MGLVGGGPSMDIGLGFHKKLYVQIYKAYFLMGSNIYRHFEFESNRTKMQEIDLGCNLWVLHGLVSG